MSLTTLISNTNTNTIPYSTLQYTQKSYHTFHVEIWGEGVDAFLGEISKKRAIRFKDWTEERLHRLVRVYDTNYGTPQGLRSEIPFWAREADHMDYFGIDLSKPFNMTIFDADENIVFVNDHRDFEMVQLLNSDITNDEDDDTASYLYAKDVYPCSCRFTVRSAKPFDPMLIAFDTHSLFGSLILHSVEYDGKNIVGEMLDQPWADVDQREIKIIYN